MLKMENSELPDSVKNYLSIKQNEIDAQDSYERKVKKGKDLWGTKSRVQFRIIRGKLEGLCVGKRRCNYCEDSVADEVEHIKPKDLYPELVFAWMNYLFACGNCNGPKNNSFAVFSNEGDVIEISRKRGDQVNPPLVGDDVFINPRHEDPLDFLILDLKTSWFLPKPRISARDRERAKYTINILRLNSRDFLLAARKEAFHSYYDALRVYVLDKKSGKSEADLAKKKNEINSRQHPTVWAEMKRQHSLHPEINTLFSDAPELLE
ncbi:hypothetical protein ACWJJH_05135 [Endozoicomonadaceae bacterium StTr2]